MSRWRAGVAAIRDRRAAGAARFLLTGATGFLGAHLLRELLARGHAVTALVRPGRDGSAVERLRRVLGWLGIDAAAAARVAVVAGDVVQERLGLSDDAWRALAGGVDEVVHCAAATSFAEARRAELEAVNIGGTRNVLALAAAGGASSVHLVSTAYVAGSVAGLVDERWREPPGFTNAYEETKHRSEALARDAAAAAGIRLSVYRPSVVYGDSVSGRSLRFNALYHPVRTLLLLRDLGLARGGGGEPGLGIAPLPGGGARLPLRVETDPAAALNLVPVDHFARAFAALLEAAPGGGTFHVVSDEAVPVQRVIGYLRRRYRLVGLEAAPASAFTAMPRTPLETLFERYLGLYRPYLLDRRRFDDAGARPHLAGAGLRCPRFDFAVFDRALAYAEQVDWGRRLFEEGPAGAPPAKIRSFPHGRAAPRTRD